MSRIAGQFTRVESRLPAGKLALGLLSDLPCKNCWTTAEWDSGHRAAPVAGDEVCGGNPRLRAALEARGTGYVLAVACSHEVTTGAAKFRADTLARRCPRGPWQKLSAGGGAKGHRCYDRAVIDLTGPRPGGRQSTVIPHPTS